MKGDIALVGFVLTAAEWQALDTDARTQLLSAAFRRGSEPAASIETEVMPDRRTEPRGHE